MNEEKLTLKREKSNKAGQAKGGKPKDKSAEQAMANELSETQSTFEPIGNPNIELYTKHPERSYSLKESLKNYLMIKNNNYLNRARKVPTEDDILKCECVPGNAIPKRINPETSLSLDCGKKCLNSIISIECDASVCPCGSRCQNRKFQRHQNAKVYPIQFGDKGFGLVAAEFIPKETFIIQYIGEVLSLNSEIGKKRLQEYSKSTCTYMMRLSSKEVIDPTYKGNMARFINHSCDPNCETRKWNVRGEIEVGIISVKDIQEGEELTFDYKFDVYQTPFTRCLCGTSKCKGYLGLVPVEYTLEEWEEKIDNLPCEICGSTSESNHNQLLLCDFCNNGFHMLCCDPPIVEIPQGAWFCKKCSLGGDVDMQPIVEKPVEEKIEQKPTAYVKPVKQMLLNDKKLRNFYVKQKRKGLKVILEKDENDQDDPEEEFLKPYNEFYAFQNQIQTEVIYEFLDEIKAEKRDAERSTKERMATEPTQDKKRDNDTEDKVLDEALNVEDDLDEEEPTSRVDEPQKAANLQPEPAQTEAKNAYDKIKVEITNQFSKTFANSEIYKNLNDNQYLTELNKQGEIARKVMPISSVELTLFQSLCRLVTKAMPSAKLFWNNSHAFHPDVFAKTIEFTITGTTQQANLVRDIFKLMEDAINWYKRVSGFTTATIFVPAIYLKRVVGEFQKNM